MATERQQWMEDVVKYTVERPGTMVGQTINAFLADSHPAFGRWWHRLSGRSHTNFRSEANERVYQARVEAGKRKKETVTA